MTATSKSPARISVKLLMGSSYKLFKKDQHYRYVGSLNNCLIRHSARLLVLAHKLPAQKRSRAALRQRFCRLGFLAAYGTNEAGCFERAFTVKKLSELSNILRV